MKCMRFHLIIVVLTKLTIVTVVLFALLKGHLNGIEEQEQKNT